MSSNARGAIFALISFGLFATHDVFVKLLGGFYSPVQIVFFSVLLGFPLATLMLMRDAKPGTLLPVHPWWMLLRTLTAVITGFMAFYAFSVLPLAQTYTILFASPLLITVLAIPMLGERVRLRRWLAVLVGLSGVIVVLRPGGDGAELGLGHLAAMTAAVTGALNSLIVRKVGAEERAVVLLLYPMVGNFLVMGVALYWVYEPMPIEHLGMIAMIAVLAWIAARLIILAYLAGEAAIIAPMQYSQIIWATAYGYLFFDEIIDRPTLIGAGLIIASGLYIVLRESQGSTSNTTPVLKTRTRPETGTSLRVSQMLRLKDEKSDK